MKLHKRTRWKLANLREFKGRRWIESGFPWQDKFHTIEEVRAYLDEDRICCLLCGRPFKALGAHLPRVHGVSVDKYKEQFGIPWTYGLVCSDTSLRMAELASERNNIPPPATKTTKRPNCEAIQKVKSEVIHSIPRRPKTKTKEDIANRKRDWAERNKDKVKAYQSEYGKVWYQQNKDRLKELRRIREGRA